MFCLIKNICLFTSCATVVIQKPWFDSSSHGQLKMENQKDKGRSTICLGKMLGVLKRFHFLRWGKFCDHSSHCPAALWLDAKSCHILGTSSLFCAGILILLNYASQVQGSDMLVVLSQTTQTRQFAVENACSRMVPVILTEEPLPPVISPG